VPTVFLSLGILSQEPLILVSKIPFIKYCVLLARIVTTEDNRIPTRIKNPETSPEKIEDIKKYATIMKGNIRYIVNKKLRVSDTIVEGVAAIKKRIIYNSGI